MDQLFIFQRLQAKYKQYKPTIKKISEINPTINSFNTKITYPTSMQINPIFNGDFQESPLFGFEKCLKFINSIIRLYEKYQLEEHGVHNKFSH